MSNSLSALEIDHILQNKKRDFLCALDDVLDDEQYNIIGDVLDKALPEMVNKLFELEDKRGDHLPTKILCLSCKHMVEPIVRRFREGEKHHIRILGAHCHVYEEYGYGIPCTVDCHRYEPKP